MTAGITDPRRIVVSGTSRGGYLALQVAAQDARLAAVLLWSPVTDLGHLLEFEGVSSHPLVQAAAVARAADRLAGRPIWLIIGTHDTRVSTASALATSAAIAQAAQTQGLRSRLEVLVVAADGHQTPAGYEPAAVQWLRGVVAH